MRQGSHACACHPAITVLDTLPPAEPHYFTGQGWPGGVAAALGPAPSCWSGGGSGCSHSVWAVALHGGRCREAADRTGISTRRRSPCSNTGSKGLNGPSLPGTGLSDILPLLPSPHLLLWGTQRTRPCQVRLPGISQGAEYRIVRDMFSHGDRERCICHTWHHAYSVPCTPHCSASVLQQCLPV